MADGGHMAFTLTFAGPARMKTVGDAMKRMDALVAAIDAEISPTKRALHDVTIAALAVVEVDGKTHVRVSMTLVAKKPRPRRRLEQEVLL